MEQTPYMLRDLPSEERPRERMIKYGAGALSHAELLAILLRTGTRKESAVHVAQRLLSGVGGLRGLVDVSLDEMIKLKGIGPAKAIQLKAGIEMGQRLAKTRLPEQGTIRSPEDAAELLMEQMRYFTERTFCLSFFEYEKSYHCSGDAFHRKPKRFDRASARGIPRGDQMQQRFRRMRPQSSQRRSHPESGRYPDDAKALRSGGDRRDRRARSHRHRGWEVRQFEGAGLDIA